ncbi:MAG: alpha/beta hydrolase [Planctomycetes bacterium]|nr:alpha/beta hydrolase [Planctomycetota bacterium]
MRSRNVIWVSILFFLFISGCNDKKKRAQFDEMRLITKSTVSVETTADGNRYYLYKDVSYLSLDRPEKMDIYIPFGKPDKDSGFAAVIAIHGGGWREGHKSRLINRTCAEAIVEKGYAVFCPDYLLNTNDKMAWPVNIYDCKTAVRYVRKVSRFYNIDPQRIGVMGNSAGGHLALLAGFSGDNKKLDSGGLYKDHSSQVKCIVNIYGVPDVREWGSDAFVKDPSSKGSGEILALASPVTHLSKDSPPVLTIHGDKDALVPLKLSKDLAKQLSANNVEHEFVVVRGGAHAFTLYPDILNSLTDLRSHVIKFLDKHLK